MPEKYCLRLIRLEGIQGNLGAVSAHIFDLIAHVESEGDFVAGCIEGFDGAIEAVGKDLNEVVKSLFGGFQMLVDYHMEKGDLSEFLKEHGLGQEPIDEPRMSKCPPDLDGTFEYIPKNLPFIGGFQHAVGQ